MLRLGKRLWQTLTVAQRRRVIVLTGAIIVMALLEVVNVSAIAPFLALASDPTMIEDNTSLRFLYELFAFDSVNSFLVAVGLGVFGLMLISNVWSALTVWGQLRLVWSWNHQLSVRLLERYLYRPYTYFLSRNTADLSKNLLSEVQQVTNSMLRPVILSLGKLVVALGIVAVLVAMNPLLALIVTGIVGGSYAAIYAISRKRLNSIGRDRVNANKQRFTTANEALTGIKHVKVLNVERQFLERFTEPSQRFSRHQATSQTISTLPRYAIETLAFGTVILIVVYLIAKDRNLGSIVPMLGLYAFAGYRLMPALQQVFQGITALRFYSSAFETVLGDLEEEASRGTRRPPADLMPIGLASKLELTRIRFTYPGNQRPAIDEVSITITANSTVGFVGPTGSGKTTLADVVLGLLRPESGQLLVDGVPIDQDNLSAWQRSIGYVPQEIFLTDASIAENIAFGIPKENIDLDAVRHAATIAQIDDFIMQELPHGYDTIVGERGLRLSGGQRQRVGIARALYHDPDVIVFDEATSALDNATETHVMEAIRSLSGKKTIIMIAHRLTTLSDCDTIYMFEGGRLVATGSYQELLAGRGAFATLASTAQ